MLQEGARMESLLLFAQQDEVGGFLGLGCMCVGVLFGLAALAFWIWALVDAIQNPRLDSNERLIWILVIVLTTWIGAIIYFIVGRKKGL
jgi:hypothetical protein